MIYKANLSPLVIYKALYYKAESSGSLHKSFYPTNYIQGFLHNIVCFTAMAVKTCLRVDIMCVCVYNIVCIAAMAVKTCIGVDIMCVCTS